MTEDPDANERAFQPHFAAGVNVVLDYLWGATAERLLTAAARAGADGAPIRFIQVGAMSGPTIALPGAVLRSSSLVLMGSGIGSVSPARLVSVVGELLAVAVPAGFTIATTAVPLAEVERGLASDRQRDTHGVRDLLK